MSDFTPTQGRYLSFIAMYIANFGQPPSAAEIADAMQVSSPSVNRMLKLLAQRGLIKREAGVARSIQLLIEPSVLPEWASEGPSTIVMLRVQAPSSKEALVEPNKAGTKPSSVYRFKVVLDGTKPPIWRRIEVLDCSLGELHEIIQSAMGWSNCHLHAFEIDKELYHSPDSQDHLLDSYRETYEGMSIGELVKELGPKMKLGYWYDFGDDWWHTIKLEAVVDAQPNIEYPRCTGGALCCPPEDVGGIYGFYEYLAIMEDPDDPHHDQMEEWRGEFYPEAFNVQQATNRMKFGSHPFGA